MNSCFDRDDVVTERTVQTNLCLQDRKGASGNPAAISKLHNESLNITAFADQVRACREILNNCLRIVRNNIGDW